MGRRHGALAWSLAALIACDDGAPIEPTAPARPTAALAGLDRTAAAMLEHVPADTPYVLMTAEPLPARYVARVAPLVDASLAAWERELARPFASDDPELRALVDSLRGHMSADGLRALGFATNPRWVLYGWGLVPVLRLELDDGAALAGVLARIDAADGEPELRREHGHTLWTGSAPSEGIAGALAIVGDELVVAVYPPEIEAPMVAHVLGRERPRDSLARSGWMRTASRDHGLVPQLAGMIDLTRIAAILDGEGDANAQQVVTRWATPLPHDACTAAWRRLVAQAPRLWFGLRELDARGLQTAWIWQLDAGLREQLAPIAAPIAGLGRSADDEGLASVAVGIDAAAAFAVVERLTDDDALGACRPGARTDEVALPAWLVGVRGGSAVLRDWDPQGDELSGTVVIGVDDPLAWLRVVMPHADERRLRRRGRPVRLADVVGLSGSSSLREAWVARSAHALGFANGDGAKPNLRRAVAATRDDGHTWASWSVDVHGLVARMPRAARDRALASLGPAERAWADAVLDVIGRWHGRLALSRHGLEGEATLEFGR